MFLCTMLILPYFSYKTDKMKELAKQNFLICQPAFSSSSEQLEARFSALQVGLSTPQFLRPFP